jgi:uncharacterized protein (TIGR00369 family)
MATKTSLKNGSRRDELFKFHPVANFIGLTIVSATKKRIRGEMPITTSHMNRQGRVGGGLIMAMADVMGARGTVANLLPGYRTTTLESKTNFFSAGTPPMLKAEAVPLHVGRTTMVWQTTIRNADGTRVAIVTQTQIVIPPDSPLARKMKAHAESHDEASARRRTKRATARAK